MQKEISPWEVVRLKVILHGGGEKKSLDQTFLCAHTGCSDQLLQRAAKSRAQEGEGKDNM